MLVRITDESKTKLIFEITTANSEDSYKANKFKIDILDVLLELYNSDISWNKFYSAHSRHTPYETINNSNLEAETKRIFNLFIKIESSQGLSLLYETFNHLSAIYKNLQDITGYKDINETNVIDYFEYKYLQDKDKAMNDTRVLTLCNPILYSYKINPEEFLKRFWKEHHDFKYEYPELKKWLQLQINNKEHYNLLEKIIPYIIFSTSEYMEPNAANIYSMREYLEYQKLACVYKANCKKFSVHSLSEVFAIAIVQLYKNGAIIKKCDGCNKFFIPQNQNAKSCSEECIDIVKKRNSKKRNTYPCCEKSTRTIKTLQTRLETYGKNKNCNDDVYYALHNIIEYYRDVSNIVRKAIRENTKDVQHDEMFLDNFNKWCDEIILETPEVNKIKNEDDITYYELLPNSYKAIKYKYFVHKKFIYFDEK